MGTNAWKAAFAAVMVCASVPASAEGDRVVVGTLACRLQDSVLAYASFGSQNPLLCDFRPAGGMVVTRLPMRILIQLEGAPTARGQFAVWRVLGPAGTDGSSLAGEYGRTDEGVLEAVGGGPEHGLALVPAEDAEVADAMATMEPPSQGARNLAAWIAGLRLRL